MEMLMAKRRTTLAEVADAAGVSVATVSKVLNERRDVSVETRQRVQKHLRDFGYRPAGSETGRRHQSRQIELVFPHAHNAYSIAVLDGITSAAQSEGFEIVISRQLRHNGGRKAPAAATEPQTLLKSGRAGAIFLTMDATSSGLAGLRTAGFPVVVIDSVRLGGSSCISIGATNFTGGVDATEHLLALGHRRIAHAGGLASVDCSRARLAGYTSALRQAGVDFDESLVTHCAFDYEEGRRAAGYLLDRDTPPTAIFAGNDEIALGVIEEARRRSIKIPEQLSVVGFDDTFLATRSAPQLTTVAQPLVEMGRVALRSLAQLIRDDLVGTSHIELATHLVVRSSTAPPGQAEPRY